MLSRSFIWFISGLFCCLALPSCVVPPPAARPDTAIVSSAGYDAWFGQGVLVTSTRRTEPSGDELFQPHVVCDPGDQKVFVTIRQSLPAGLGEVITNTHFTSLSANLKAGKSYVVAATVTRRPNTSFWRDSIPDRQVVTFALSDKTTQKILATKEGKHLPSAREFADFLMENPDLVLLLPRKDKKR